MKDIKNDQRIISDILQRTNDEEVLNVRQELIKTINPVHLDNVKAAKKGLRLLRQTNSEERAQLIAWLTNAAELEKAGKASYDYVHSNSGATEKIVSFIQENRLLTN